MVQRADDAPDLPVLLTIQQVADLTGFKKSFLYELTSRGTLPARLVGTKLRVRREDFTAWIEGLPEKRPDVVESATGRLLHLTERRGPRDPA